MGIIQLCIKHIHQKYIINYIKQASQYTKKNSGWLKMNSQIYAI